MILEPFFIQGSPGYMHVLALGCRLFVSEAHSSCLSPPGCLCWSLLICLGEGSRLPTWGSLGLLILARAGAAPQLGIGRGPGRVSGFVKVPSLAVSASSTALTLSVEMARIVKSKGAGFEFCYSRLWAL